jgi:predicted nucleic-acid-binding protein
MIAIDTNILVRLLVNDATAQTQVDLAKSIFKKHRLYINS